MNVLFINPLLRKETQHPIITSMVLSSLPLGLGCVAGYLREKNKLDIKIIDEVVEPLSDEGLTRELGNFNGPLIVGFSCLTATHSRAIELATKIKKIKQDTFIVFGGVHPTVMPEESLSTGVVDVVIRSEGEMTMNELCNALNAHADWRSIKGISYCVEQQNFRHNPLREYTNLNVFPKFPYDLFERNINSYSDFGVVLSSRGCPFDCIFCSNRIVTGKRFRVFEIPYVVEQIELLVKKYQQKSINFADDNFVVNKKRFFELTNAIMEKGLHKHAYFSCQYRGEDMTEEVLEQMKRMNFRMLFCGIETSSQRLMNVLDKSEMVDDIKQGVKLSHSKGMLTSGTFIMGIPTETRKDRFDSMKFSRQLPLDSTRFNIAIPYPGTRLFEIAKQEGRLHIASGWKNFNVQYYLFGDDIPYVPATSGRYSLIFDTMWANMRFYLRPKILFTIIFKKYDVFGGAVSLQNRRKRVNTYCNIFKIASFMVRRFAYIAIRALFERNNNFFGERSSIVKGK